MCHFLGKRSSLVFMLLFLSSCLPKTKDSAPNNDNKQLALNAAEADIQEPLNKSLVEEVSLNLHDDAPLATEVSFPEEDTITNDSTELPEHLKNQKVETIERTMTLPDLYNTANLVIKGKVEQIDYRVSTPNAEGFRAPLTFVKVRIEDILKGRFSSKNITLKFVGGPVGSIFSTSEQTPLFNIGDKDILFIKGNGEFFTPVSHSWRVRIVNNHVYSELGTLVPAPINGDFLPEEDVGPDGVSTKKVHDMIIEIVKSESIGENGSAIQRNSKEITLAEYETALKSLQPKAKENLQLTSNEIEVTLNPNQDLTVPSF